MSLHLAPGNYISRLWFFYKPGADMDVMAYLWRKLSDGVWTFEYRFRYYNDEESHNSTDRKSGYRGTFDDPVTEEELLSRIDGIAQIMLSELLPVGYQLDVTDVRSDVPEVILHLFGQKPYMHFKMQEAIN